MITDYFHWQYAWAPRWMFRVFANLQLALWQFFSVTIMLRTLISHWHKDVIKYRGGSLENYAMTFAWNQVSRLIGFIIRTTVLLTWLAAEAVFIPLAIVIFILFVLWPLLVLLLFSLGFALLFM